MFKKYLIAVTVVLMGTASIVKAFDSTSDVANNSAAKIDATATADFDAEKLKAQFNNALALNVISIKPAPMGGLVELLTDQGLFYASADGKFFIHGKLYGLEGDVTNYSEESLAEVRIAGMETFENAMIVYPAEKEEYVVTVFTDITCGYCRKMHEKMDEYNAKGITIRYLAYPRSGIKDQYGRLTKGYDDLRSIWCHENPEAALTKAKAGSSVAQRICDKPVEEEFNFGRQVGVTGTPAVILDNGMMLSGYREPSQLLAILQQMKASS